MHDDLSAHVKRLGSTGTPTTFVNGPGAVGAQPVETFEQIIDEALTHASPSKLSR